MEAGNLKWATIVGRNQKYNSICLAGLPEGAGSHALALTPPSPNDGVVGSFLHRGN